MKSLRGSRGGGRDAEVVEWLLENENPAVKYLTLVDLEGVSPRSARAAEARRAIPGWGPVKKILARQHQDGGWDSGGTWYLPKYRSSVWQLIVLSQTGIDPELSSVRRMCRYAFRFQNESAAFISGMTENPADDWARLAGCLNGNVIASMSRLGWARDRRIGKAVEHLLTFQEPDGGWTCRSFGYHSKDRHSCFMGTICALEGLLEYTEEVRSRGAEEAKQRACEFILMHKLLRADHHGWRFIRPSWAQLHAPWLVGYSLLRSLRVLTRAGYADDPRMEEGIGILLSKRRRNGRWRREVSWPSNSYGSFGSADTYDKWITLNAMLVLRAVDGAEAV